MALSIFVLIATGFYIADPFTVYPGETVDKFFMGDVRFWHILFGVILGFLFVWRIYLAFFSRFQADWKDFFAWTNWKNTIKQVAFLPARSRRSRRSTPISTARCSPWPTRASCCMVFLILLTGLILMGAGYDAGLTAFVYMLVKPLENWMGGLATVRWIHHILMWGFILFIAGSRLHGLLV